MTKPPLKGYQFVPTEDQSVTLFSEAFNEACHSTHGAREETRQIYLEGCDLKGLKKEIKDSPLRILEIGFGAGIGVIETFKYAKTQELGPVEMITTEIDPDLVDYLLATNEFSSFKVEHNTPLPSDLRKVVASCEDFKLTILIGDARHTLSSIGLYRELGPVHAIYQDAFSPKRNPALWSIQWFELLRDYWSTNLTKLSTYSASNSVRKAMRAAGWNVEIAPGFGPKRQSTRATISGSLDPELALTLERSGAQALIDEELRQSLTRLKGDCTK